MPLCTDLHPDNVLAAGREPWLVIDPKPYLGDPTYDPLRHMLNHSERLRADRAGFPARMADLIDLDAGRLQQWIFARSVQDSVNDPHLRAVATEMASRRRQSPAPVADPLTDGLCADDERGWVNVLVLDTGFMTVIELRRPAAADAERIEEIRMAAWRRAYRGMIAQDVLEAFPGDPGRRRDGILHPRPGTVDWVALDGDSIIGWIRGGGSRDDDAGPDTREIYACYVAPTHWRGGVGTILMRAALDALSAPSSEVTLWVLSANLAARAFYESLGFRPDGACKPLDIDPTAEEMRYTRGARSL